MRLNERSCLSAAGVQRRKSTFLTLRFQRWKKKLLAFHTAEIYADVLAECIAIGCSAAILYFYWSHLKYQLQIMESPTVDAASPSTAMSASNQLFVLGLQFGAEIGIDYLASLLEINAGIDFDELRKYGPFVACVFISIAVINIQISAIMYMRVDVGQDNLTLAVPSALSVVHLFKLKLDRHERLNSILAPFSPAQSDGPARVTIPPHHRLNWRIPSSILHGNNKKYCTALGALSRCTVHQLEASTAASAAVASFHWGRCFSCVMTKRCAYVYGIAVCANGRWNEVGEANTPSNDTPGGELLFRVRRSRLNAWNHHHRSWSKKKIQQLFRHFASTMRVSACMAVQYPDEEVTAAAGIVGEDADPFIFLTDSSPLSIKA